MFWATGPWGEPLVMSPVGADGIVPGVLGLLILSDGLLVCRLIREAQNCLRQRNGIFQAHEEHGPSAVGTGVLELYATGADDHLLLIREIDAYSIRVYHGNHLSGYGG